MTSTFNRARDDSTNLSPTDRDRVLEEIFLAYTPFLFPQSLRNIGNSKRSVLAFVETAAAFLEAQCFNYHLMPPSFGHSWAPPIRIRIRIHSQNGTRCQNYHYYLLAFMITLALRRERARSTLISSLTGYENGCEVVYSMVMFMNEI